MLRDWTAAQRTLRRHGVTLDEISARSGVTLASVCRALSRHHFAGVAYGSVAKMRGAAEDLLVERGYSGDIESLWDDYDRLLFPPHPDEPEPPAAA